MIKRTFAEIESNEIFETDKKRQKFFDLKSPLHWSALKMFETIKRSAARIIEDKENVFE